MRRVIIVTAGDADSVLPFARKFAAEINGNVAVLMPESDENYDEWLRKHASKADVILVMYLGSPPAAAKINDEVPAGSARALFHHVDAYQLGNLPGLQQVLVVLPGGSGIDPLPQELRNYRTFDLSIEDSRQALLCSLVHEPVLPGGRRRSQEATVAGAKLISGVAATIFGNVKILQQNVMGYLPPAAAVTLYVVMVVFVLCLVLSGLLPLLSIGVDYILSTVDFLRKRSKGKALHRYALVAMLAVPLVAVGLRYLPKPPLLTGVVDENQQAWFKRLQSSQNAMGGIQVHPTKGITQSWITAQALVGFLLGPPQQRLSPKDTQRAFEYLERNFIADIRLRPGGTETVSAILSQQKPEVISSGFLQSIPTLEYALAVIGRQVPALSDDIKKNILSRKDQIFLVTPRDEGWGYFEQWDYGVTEIAAWVAVAYIESLRIQNPPIWEQSQRPQVRKRVLEILELIGKREIKDSGSYSPINDTTEASFARTYSTIMSLWATVEALQPDMQLVDSSERERYVRRIRSTISWLEGSAIGGSNGHVGGWKVNPHNPVEETAFLGLTAQTLCILSRVPKEISGSTRSYPRIVTVKRSILQGQNDWITRRVSENDRIHDADRYLYPKQIVIEGSTFLWYPWTAWCLHLLHNDSDLSAAERNSAAGLLKKLASRIKDFDEMVEQEFNYVAAEALIGFNWHPIGGPQPRKWTR